MTDESVENIIRQWPCPSNCEDGAIPHGSLVGEGLDWSECQFCAERDEVVCWARELEAEVERLRRALENLKAVAEDRYERLAVLTAEIYRLKNGIGRTLAGEEERLSDGTRVKFGNDNE